MAGALGILLGGTNYYDGVAHEAPSIGDGTADITPGASARRLASPVVTYGLGLFFALLSLWVSPTASGAHGGCLCGS